MNKSEVSKKQQQFNLIPWKDRNDKWLEEENYLPRFQAQHKLEIEKLKRKYKKEIVRLRNKVISKRRCSKCLFSGHTKRTCQNE